MRALPRARCRGLQERSQLLAPNQLRCFGLCHGCTLFDLAPVSSLGNRMAPSSPLALPCRPRVARATRARRISSGISAPPISYSVNGKQYVAVLVGSKQPFFVLQNAPELKNSATASILYVFGL